jgi:protein-S-isoprenylcysteine O-methyltransferase Ste14
MKFFLLLLNLVLCLGLVGAFAPVRSSSLYKTSSKQASQEPFSDLQDKFKDVTSKLPDMDSVLAKLNMDGITDNLDKVRENVWNGEFGTRGEVYVAAQAVLTICIVLGGVPFVGDLAMFLGGPVLLLAGAALIFIAVNDLGASLSPWPVPSSNSELQTDGIYGELRHPTYAGVLAVCAGFSILTGSANRLLLTAFLFYLFEIKTDKEEEELIKLYPQEYVGYREKVPTKFFPLTMIKQLPWTNKQD